MKKLFIILIIIFVLPSSVSFAKTLLSGQINNILKEQGHFIRFIGDKKYTLLNKESMEQLINNIMVKAKFLDSKLLDCDDISLILHAEIRKHRYDTNNKYPIAFGEAVIKSIGGGENHALNFFITDKKIIYIFDPYEFKFYPINKVKLLFIRM